MLSSILLKAVALAFLASNRAIAKHSPPLPVDKCQAYPVNVHQTWVVTETETNYYQPASSARGPAVPLSSRRYSILINDTFPGPLLTATVGDWVRIDVISQLLSTSISIHWHGIHQTGTPWADGTVMVSSCAIDAAASGGAASFSYIFQVDIAGTYWYHGHTTLEHEYGVMGGIVVLDPQDPNLALYDLELPTPIIVNDWWWDPNGAYTNINAYNHYETLEGAVINGYSGNGSPESPLVVIATLQQGLCYRVRFINANGEWEGWQASIAGPGNSTKPWPFTIIAVDSVSVEPFSVTALGWYASERFDAVLCADGPVGNYTLTMTTVQNIGTCAQILGCQNKTSALISVVGPKNGSSTVNRTKLASFPQLGTFDVMQNFSRLVPSPPLPLPPGHASEVWTFKMGFSPFGAFLWTAGWDAFALPSAPYLYTKGKCGVFNPANSSTIGPSGPATHVKTVASLGSVVDMIVNNVNSKTHVYHVHGYNFWVLGSGYYGLAGNSTTSPFCPGPVGSIVPLPPGAPPVITPNGWGCVYDAALYHKTLNLVNPSKTDSFSVPAQGWAYIRIKLDNPGAWYVHCHVNSHMLEGMAYIIDVAPKFQPPIPAWVNTRCGGVCEPAAKQVCGPFSPEPAPTDKCVTDCEANAAGYCTGDTPAVYTATASIMGKKR